MSNITEGVREIARSISEDFGQNYLRSLPKYELRLSSFHVDENDWNRYAFEELYICNKIIPACRIFWIRLWCISYANISRGIFTSTELCPGNWSEKMSAILFHL